METHQPVTLAWSNIDVFVRDKKKKKTTPAEVDVELGKDGTVKASSEKYGRKQIISNVSGVVRPGTLVAVMGASGAGKSTLMNVLTNRNLKDYIVKGDITINGVAVGSGIRNVSAYVQQDDLFMETLTVRETLKFRALLRMDQRLSRKARMERVEEVINELGLTKCADTQIGGGRSGRRGISGGESKRLSFACEMLTNPPLLFCDEPTSGLDSFMAQSIVQTLQNMASKNHTVMCTIHQPSSEVFALFDRVLLMAEGRVAFMGSCADAMKFFNNMNYVCPTNFNPADFFVLTLAIVPGQEDECRRKVHAICDGFADSSDAKEITQSIKDVSERANSGAIDLEVAREAKKSTIRYEASWGSQFLTVLWRSWIAGVRDVFLFRVRVMQTLIVALVIGLIYLQLDYDQKGVMDINGGIFMLVANTTMVNLFSVINSFPVEITLFLREYGSGLYRSDIYYIAKSIAELPTFIVLPIVSMTIDYWMMGLYNSAEAYLVAIGVSVLIANVSMSFGHVVSTLTGSVNIALAIAPPVVIPFMMFGGFFLNTE
nr:hypothetical protein BaRGS_000215 [Batillaria attramentaria]